jgi:hypothetical protein
MRTVVVMTGTPRTKEEHYLNKEPLSTAFSTARSVSGLSIHRKRNEGVTCFARLAVKREKSCPSAR